MNLDSKQIYLLDDEDSIRRSLELILTAEGYDVKAFPLGADLIKDLRNITDTAPSVALLDLNLPDMSGVAVMDKIKERSPETEVVMLSGNPDMKSAIESVNVGAYAFLVKPYGVDELRNVLERIQEKQRLVRENRELTQRLKEWNTKLEEEVRRRTLSLQESFAKLQSLYQMRTQFISIMSHELRTPSTALMGFADTLKEKWESLPKEKTFKYLNIISVEANRLVRLMSKIFEISKIQEGSLDMTLEKADMKAFLKAAIEEYLLFHSDARIEAVPLAEPASAQIDSLYLKSALSHVLDNAIKYSPEGEPVRAGLQKSGRDVLIFVEDSGPGVAPDLREKVFEAFYREMDDVNRRTPGAGLGLTIARGILTGMKGTIRIEDGPGGKGCRTVLSLPSASSSKHMIDD